VILSSSTPEDFASGKKRYGYLFGSERNGLKNEHLTLATAILSIPTFPAFSSLNLGQAVQVSKYGALVFTGRALMLLCYVADRGV
jgi:tRNA C32,U32 (ribose-2'-O)-methylase TrmJ